MLSSAKDLQIEQIRAKAFNGIVISFTGLSMDIRSELTKLVEEMGGRGSPALDDTVTHLIAEICDNRSEKYVAARKRKIPVMLPTWIYEARKNQNQAVLSNFACADILELYRTPFFAGCEITISGFSGTERIDIGRLVEMHGGVFTGQMSKHSCTHLIAANNSGEKYRRAKEWRTLFVVSDKWLRKSIESKARLPESKFPVAGDRASTDMETFCQEKENNANMAKRPQEQEQLNNLTPQTNSTCAEGKKSVDAEQSQSQQQSELQKCLTAQLGPFPVVGADAAQNQQQQQPRLQQGQAVQPDALLEGATELEAHLSESKFPSDVDQQQASMDMEPFCHENENNTSMTNGPQEQANSTGANEATSSNNADEVNSAQNQQQPGLQQVAAQLNVFVEVEVATEVEARLPESQFPSDNDQQQTSMDMEPFCQENENNASMTNGPQEQANSTSAEGISNNSADEANTAQNQQQQQPGLQQVAAQLGAFLEVVTKVEARFPSAGDQQQMSMDMEPFCQEKENNATNGPQEQANSTGAKEGTSSNNANAAQNQQQQQPGLQQSLAAQLGAFLEVATDYYRLMVEEKRRQLQNQDRGD